MQALFWLVAKSCSAANSSAKQLRKVGQLGCLHTWKITITKILASTCTEHSFCHLLFPLSLCLVYHVSLFVSHLRGAQFQVDKEIASVHDSTNQVCHLHEKLHTSKSKELDSIHQFVLWQYSESSLAPVFHVTPTWLPSPRSSEDIGRGSFPQRVSTDRQ